MEVSRVAEYSWLILIGPKKFPILAGFSENNFSIFLAFDADDAENARAAKFGEIWIPAVIGKGIPYNCPKSLPCGWRVSAVPTGCVGGASWLFTRCSQRILVASPRMKISLAPLPAADFVLACNVRAPSLSMLLRSFLADRGKITIFEGSCAAAEAAAAAAQAPVVVVGKIAKLLLTRRSDFYEFQPKSVQLEILDFRPINPNLFFVDFMTDLSPTVAPRAIFVPREGSAAAEAWVYAHSKMPCEVKLCEPDMVSVEELKKATSGEIITEGKVIPPSVTRTISGRIDSSRASIKSNPDGLPELVPS